MRVLEQTIGAPPAATADDRARLDVETYTGRLWFGDAARATRIAPGVGKSASAATARTWTEADGWRATSTTTTTGRLREREDPEADQPRPRPGPRPRRLHEPPHPRHGDTEGPRGPQGRRQLQLRGRCPRPGRSTSPGAPSTARRTSAGQRGRGTRRRTPRSGLGDIAAGATRCDAETDEARLSVNKAME